MATKTLNVDLQENFVTEDPNDYFARVQYQQTLRNKDFAREIREDGSEVRAETIEYILNLGDQKKAERLAEGYVINTPFCIAKAGTTGVYNSETELFDKTKHSLTANFTKGTIVREQLDNVEVRVQGVAKTDPIIGKVTDTLTGISDSTITPGNVIQISGKRLKIDGDSAEIGLTLRNIDDDSFTKITQVIINEPKQLLVMLPSLPAGNYELKLCTAYSGNSVLLKTPKKSTFTNILSVE